MSVAPRIMYTRSTVWVKTGSHAHSGEAPGEVCPMSLMENPNGITMPILKNVYLNDVLLSLCMGKRDAAFGVRD